MASRSTTRCAKHYTYGRTATQVTQPPQTARDESKRQGGGARTQGPKTQTPGMTDR